jgi:hypothetical protein
MTPRIPLIIGIAVTALAFGVPTALGENALSIEKTRSRVETPKAVPYKPGPVVKGSWPPHSFTGAARGYVDADKRSVGPTNPIGVSDTHSGIDMEWAQLGVGLGLGLLLAVGSFLAVRMTRARRLFH